MWFYFYVIWVSTVYVLKHHEWREVATAVLKLSNSSLKVGIGGMHPVCSYQIVLAFFQNGMLAAHFGYITTIVLGPVARSMVSANPG